MLQRLTKLMLALALVAVAVPSAKAQSDEIPISGTLVDMNGKVVAGAEVKLIRESKGIDREHGFSEAAGMMTLGKGHTDAAGRFSFGPVDLQKTSPFVETGVDFSFRIFADGRLRTPIDIQSTAHRSGAGLTLQSIEFKITIVR